MAALYQKPAGIRPSNPDAAEVASKALGTRRPGDFKPSHRYHLNNKLKSLFSLFVAFQADPDDASERPDDSCTRCPAD
jgi:hypothetical protein